MYAMIDIAITAEAFDAIVATLPLGSVFYARERTATGDYFFWLERARRRAARLAHA
jgi:hypothetical protein